MENSSGKTDEKLTRQLLYECANKVKEGQQKYRKQR